MLRITLLLNLFFVVQITSRNEDESNDDAELISSLRNDANLDLSVDEEYEELRADLLAYNTALASLTSEATRKSMGSTPCWTLGGICIKYDLCVGTRFLSEVPGCRGRNNVCCFGWNIFKAKDMRDKGIAGFAMPWGLQSETGGKGVIMKDKGRKKKKKRKELVQKLPKESQEEKAAESIVK